MTTTPAFAATHDDAVMVLRGVRDEAGNLVDATIEFANERWRAQLTAGGPAAGRSFRHDFAGLASDRWPVVEEALEQSAPVARVFPNFGSPGSWGEVHLTPLGDDRVLVVVREVTGSEEQREALRRSEARFRLSLDQSPDTIALVRPLVGEDGRLIDVEPLYLNRAALERWFDGIRLEELAGRRLFEEWPVVGAHLRDLYQGVLDRGEPFDGLLRLDSPKGPQWGRVRVVATPEGIVHTSQDMTNVILAQEELARTVQDLEEAQVTGHVGSFEWDPATDRFVCSDEYLRLLGFDPRNGLPSTADRMSRLDPVVAPRLDEEVRALAIGGSGSYERLIEGRIPGAGDRWLLFRGRIVNAPDGSVRVAGTATDVTALHRAEQEVAASEARFATVVNTVEEAIAIARPVLDGGELVNLEIEWANPAWLRREGLDALPAGLRGLELHPEFGRLCPVIAEVLETGVSASAEVHLANGRWLAASVARVDDRVLVAALDITARRAAQEADRVRLESALERTTDAISITDVDGRLVYVNAAFEAMSGVPREAALGQVPAILRAAPSSDRPSAVDAQLRRGEPFHHTVERRRPDGTAITVETSISPVLDGAGVLTGFVAITRDVTNARAELARRAQADRLEAVGQLAGGVAHDFNNILAAIISYGEFALDTLAGDAPARGEVEQILVAAERASLMTKSLLAFSRRQAIEVRVLDAVATIGALLPMLRGLIGEHIAITSTLDPATPTVTMDPGHLDQIVTNLAVNARDAMPTGGRLEIRVEPAVRDGQPVARITVGDTGEGMDEHVRAHLFEPFFTTKQSGSGTGLGLATVHGIVTTYSGVIEVASAPGSGSTFVVDIPGHAAPVETPRAPVQTVGGTEHVLVVEDDVLVRDVTVRILRALGYTVAEAASAASALELVSDDMRIDLLVTDVRMPGIQGPELARRIRALRPGARVLFISGLVDQLEPGERVGAEVLEKPFGAGALGEAVRRALA